MRALFINADKTLVPGLFARVRLEGGMDARMTNAVLINERAIGTDQSRKYVYVVGAQNKAEYRQVTLGPAADGMRVVRSGLTVGEKIVVNGLPRVQAGALLAPHMVSMDFDPDAPEIKKSETPKLAAAAAKKG
jgi:membrane fusion protein, multidrug efflux system